MPEPEDVLGKFFAPEENSDVALAKAISTLNKPENIKHFSQLGEDEIKLGAALITMSKILNDHSLASYVDHVLHLRVSANRQGRGEIVQISMAMAHDQQQQQQNKGLVQRFLGR